MWLSQPLGTCVHCVSGQMAFWYYLYIHFAQGIKYSIVEHIFVVSLSIFMVDIYTRWIRN